MTIREFCPHCGATGWKDGRWSCGTDSVGCSRTPLCKLNQAAKELLKKNSKQARENLARQVV